MAKNTNIKSENLVKYFECSECQYITYRKYDYNKHILTSKHKRLTKDKSILIENSLNDYKCKCGRKYKHMSSLCKHKKVCKNDNYEIEDETLDVKDDNISKMFDMFKDLMVLQSENQSKQTEKLIQEQTKLMQELIPKIGNTTNNTQNNQFNINMFLNEKCKDAMNID